LRFYEPKHGKLTRAPSLPLSSIPRFARSPRRKSLGWRTALVVPELAQELESTKKAKAIGKTLHLLRKYRQDIGGSYVDELNDELEDSKNPPSDERVLEIEALLLRVSESESKVKNALKILGKKHHHHFNSRWGELFKTGAQRSRFSYYVENYACVFLEKASDFSVCSKGRTLSASTQFMVHDSK
jgi:hypothetical protein